MYLIVLLSNIGDMGHQISKKHFSQKVFTLLFRSVNVQSETDT